MILWEYAIIFPKEGEKKNRASIWPRKITSATGEHRPD